MHANTAGRTWVQNKADCLFAPTLQNKLFPHTLEAPLEHINPQEETHIMKYEGVNYPTTMVAGRAFCPLAKSRINKQHLGIFAKAVPHDTYGISSATQQRQHPRLRQMHGYNRPFTSQ